MRILLIDTCTERSVIAYSNEDGILFEKELPFGLNQSKFLMPCLEDILQDLGIPPPLDVIGVGVGPGSYTGIRLGVSVAQGLAYSWKIPLVGVCSLEGFIPSVPSIDYAAVLDARVSGVYFQKGWINQEGNLCKSHAQAVSMDEVKKHLRGITYLVTPFAKFLQVKFERYCPDKQWKWEERSPSVSALLQAVKKNYIQGKIVIPPNHLNLIYLRQTEAEIKKNNKK